MNGVKKQRAENSHKLSILDAGFEEARKDPRFNADIKRFIKVKICVYKLQTLVNENVLQKRTAIDIREQRYSFDLWRY